MLKDNKNKQYILTIEYNPDTDRIEFVQEEIVETSPQPIIFTGNAVILDYMDDDAISLINCYEIGET
jgi:hypothetical protein